MRIIYIFPETPEGLLSTEWCDELDTLKYLCDLHQTADFLTVSVPTEWTDLQIQDFAEQLTN